MIEWMYKVVKVNLEEDSLPLVLNRLGKDGWEAFKVEFYLETKMCLVVLKQPNPLPFD